MIVHHSGKSYDTSDGSEQSHAASLPPPQDAGSLARWADDGAVPSTPAPKAATKPAWSVLGVRALNAAIARGRRTNDPARVRHAAEQAARERVAADDAARDRAADAARAWADRYRNAWETT